MIARMMSTAWLVTACRIMAATIVNRIWNSEVPITTAVGTRNM